MAVGAGQCLLAFLPPAPRVRGETEPGQLRGGHALVQRRQLLELVGGQVHGLVADRVETLQQAMAVDPHLALLAQGSIRGGAHMAMTVQIA